MKKRLITNKEKNTSCAKSLLYMEKKKDLVLTMTIKNTIKYLKITVIIEELLIISKI